MAKAKTDQKAQKTGRIGAEDGGAYGYKKIGHMGMRIIICSVKIGTL